MKKYRADHYNLYFIIRSIITALIGFSMFSILAFVFGNLTYIQAIIFSLICSAFSIFFSRVFHENIQNLVEKIFAYIKNHKRTEKVVLKILK